jgi:hypothetical protein
MYSKLVRLHPLTKRFTDVDRFRLRREAMDLQSYLETELDHQTDIYEIYNNVNPLVKAVAMGTLPLPFEPSNWPLTYVLSEGLLPRSFTKLFSKFKLTASGTPLDELEIQTIDGHYYAMMDFEEEGDYPDNVKYP